MLSDAAGLTYAVVSPVRDEERYLPMTAQALIAQTARPAQWVIVDDGSSDRTGEIADELAAGHDWIVAIHRPRRETRERGGPIVRAFEAGRELVDPAVDVVVKLDGDLHLPAEYFDWVLAVFARMPRAGIVGGTLYIHDGHRWFPDQVGRHTVHGAAKSYRTAALAEMGGLQPAMGWDGIDEYAARARDWQVVPLSELSVLHYKPRGSKQKWWRARWEEGKGAHFMGYGFHGIAVRVAYRAVREHPPLLGGLAIGAGYLWALLTRKPRNPDAAATALMRDEQRTRLRNLLRGRGDLQPTPAPDGGPAFWALEQAAGHDG
jgi:biofilm PGA synthesis N-glycosyltransferase PgaC